MSKTFKNLQIRNIHTQNFYIVNFLKRIELLVLNGVTSGVDSSDFLIILPRSLKSSKSPQASCLVKSGKKLIDS